VKILRRRGETVKKGENKMKKKLTMSFSRTKRIHTEGLYKMKCFVFFGILFLIGMNCFAQQLKVTSVQDNGEYIGFGEWPKNNFFSARARSEWDSLFSKYNLVEVESDPFEGNNLADRIASIANGATGTTYSSGLPRPRPFNKAYTVYMSWGNRRFICFIAYDLSDYYTWAYEVK
jgi:hypothetical protein